jgi:hypothetical protein
MPPPWPEHLAFLADYSPRLNEILSQAGHPRCVFVIQLDSRTGRFQTGHSPTEHVDLPHLMEIGVPEGPAITLMEQLKNYDSRREALVVITEVCPNDRSKISLVTLTLEAGCAFHSSREHHA